MRKQVAMTSDSKILFQLVAIYNVSIVDHPQAIWVTEHKGLDVHQVPSSDSTVTGMPDRQITRKGRHIFTRENGIYQTQVFYFVKPQMVIGKNAGRILPPML